MGLYTAFAVILGVWGVITLVRGIAESEQTHGRTDTRTRGHADDDAIDYEELRRAEEDVRDLGTNARPEDGFEGDDWGPGAPKKH